MRHLAPLEERRQAGQDVSALLPQAGVAGVLDFLLDAHSSFPGEFRQRACTCVRCDSMALLDWLLRHVWDALCKDLEGVPPLRGGGRNAAPRDHGQRGHPAYLRHHVGGYHPLHDLDDCESTRVEKDGDFVGPVWRTPRVSGVLPLNPLGGLRVHHGRMAPLPPGSGLCPLLQKLAYCITIFRGKASLRSHDIKPPNLRDQHSSTDHRWHPVKK